MYNSIKLQQMSQDSHQKQQSYFIAVLIKVILYDNLLAKPYTFAICNGIQILENIMEQSTLL